MRFRVPVLLISLCTEITGEAAPRIQTQLEPHMAVVTFLDLLNIAAARIPQERIAPCFGHGNNAALLLRGTGRRPCGLS